MKKLTINADEFATIEVVKNGISLGEFQIVIDGVSWERSEPKNTNTVNVRINDAKSLEFNPNNIHAVVISSDGVFCECKLPSISQGSTACMSCSKKAKRFF